MNLGTREEKSDKAGSVRSFHVDDICGPLGGKRVDKHTAALCLMQFYVGGCKECGRIEICITTLPSIELIKWLDGTFLLLVRVNVSVGRGEICT